GPTTSLRVRATAGGAPAAGAVLRAFSQGSGTRAVEVATATTGPDGEARLDGLPAGATCVWARGAGGTVGRAGVALPLERTALPVEIGLSPARALRVEVYEARRSDVPPPWNEEKDVPIAGAVVRALAMTASPGPGAWWPVPAGGPGSREG